MAFARGFFDLQIAFAERVHTLSGMRFEKALLDYTNLYVRLGLGRDFDGECDGRALSLSSRHSVETQLERQVDMVLDPRHAF